ncbi:MAG: hypothetical protein WCG78_04165 [Candidatus Omnitrophota bacterium]
MRIYRFSITLLFVMLVALLYVHQQVQLIKIGYKIETNEKEVTGLLDRNKNLVYTITRLKSPVSLEKKFLASAADFTIPQRSQIVELSMPRVEREAPARTTPKENTYLAFLKKMTRPREVFANTAK